MEFINDKPLIARYLTEEPVLTRPCVNTSCNSGSFKHKTTKTEYKSLLNYVSPLEGSGDILFFTLASVGLSVCGSVCHKSCPLYNLITVTDISTKLHTFVKHIRTTCHAQEP